MWHLIWWNEYSLTLLCNWYLWASVSEWCKLLIFVSICSLSIVTTTLSRFESCPPHPYVEDLKTSECIWRKHILFVYICTVYVCVFHEDMWVYTRLHMHVKATGWCLLFFIIFLHLTFWDGISQRTWLLLFQSANPRNHLIPLPPTRDFRCHAIFLFNMSARDLNSHPHAHTANTSLIQLGVAYSSMTHTLSENARTQAHREETTVKAQEKAAI